MSISAMKQALDALEELNEVSKGQSAICLPAEIDTAMDALRQAIADAEKPDLARVGEVGVWGDKREWVGLEEEEILKCFDSVALGQVEGDCVIDKHVNIFNAIRAIEAKLKEKNT